MDTSRKIILTSTVTGGAPFNRKHPAMPVTPAEIAAAALEAAAAGASVAHSHVRDPLTGDGSHDPALFRKVGGVHLGDLVHALDHLRAGQGLRGFR